MQARLRRQPDETAAALPTSLSIEPQTFGEQSYRVATTAKIADARSTLPTAKSQCRARNALRE